MARATERYREGRASTARDLKQARSSGVVSGVRLLVSENDCRVCQALKAIVFPLKSCTLDMLPPYRNCDFEEGCRASITMVIAQEYSGKPRPKKLAATKPGGPAGCVMVASILIGTIVVISMC
jgi:hypothetical protein